MTEVDLKSLVPGDLPSGAECVQEGLEVGAKLERAKSKFCVEKDVSSEREWREQCRDRGQLCTCFNIGLNTWEDTRVAIEEIYADAGKRGVRPPDRFNVIAERRMGLPKNMRESAPRETGPVLWTQQDWWELAQTVAMQPYVGDNMIGGPGSFENVVDALTAGVTYVGVMSQYAWRWPYWDDEVTQTTAVLQAAGVMASKRSEGIVWDSYIDDGLAGTFHDYANVVGWSMLERYICEELIGAAYSYSWGGLTQDPMIKSAVTMAMEAGNTSRVPSAFQQGDTIGNGMDFDANMAVLSTDVLFMKMVDRRKRLGTAPIAVPVTEAERVPSWQEVSTAQTISRKLEDYVPWTMPAIDWPAIEQLAVRLADGGRRFVKNVLDGCAAAGIDIQDPGQLMIVTKRLGAARLEELFGAGEAHADLPRGRMPVLETNLVRDTMAERERLLGRVAQMAGSGRLGGVKVIVGSTDVHEFAEYLLCAVLEAAGADVIDFGINRDPDEIVKAVTETEADVVVVTTHNGVARSFATDLLRELDVAGMGGKPIFMGGVLNEDVEGSDVPIDVREDLRQLSIHAPDSIEGLVDGISDAIGLAMR
jgi:methylmalonyl-CoA mutase cobalamin-binding subunit